MEVYGIRRKWPIYVESLFATVRASSGLEYSWEFLVGVCCPLLQILTLFGLKAEILSSLLRLEHGQKISSDAFRICIFLFSRYYSFGIETISTFIHSLSFLENQTRFQTKMGKVYTRFQTKKAQNPYRLGRHVPI